MTCFNTKKKHDSSKQFKFKQDFCFLRNVDPIQTAHYTNNPDARNVTQLINWPHHNRLCNAHCCMVIVSARIQYIPSTNASRNLPQECKVATCGRRPLTRSPNNAGGIYTLTTPWPACYRTQCSDDTVTQIVYRARARTTRRCPSTLRSRSDRVLDYINTNNYKHSIYAQTAKQYDPSWPRRLYTNRGRIAST